MMRKRGIALLLAFLVFVTAVCLPVPVEAATLKISQKTLTLTVGASKTLKITTSLKGKIVWKSSNTKVATVSSKGKVRAKKAGKAKVEAKLKGKSVSCKVTVKKKSSGMKASAAENAKTYKKQIDQILKYTNQYRKKDGRKKLKLDTKLTKAACYRSLEMAKANNLSHTRPNGSSCFTILDTYSISYFTVGENIAYTSGQGINPKTVSTGWYNSPGHRANMLNGKFGRIGIGIAVSGSGKVYYTQLFAN